MRRILAACGLLLAIGSAASAQTKGQFVIEQVGTQVATEDFTRTPTSVTGVLSMINGVRIKFNMALVANASASNLHAEVFTPADTSAAASTLDVRFTADSVIGEVNTAGNKTPMRAEVPAGTLPYINPSAVFMEQIIRRAKAIGGTDVKVFITPLGGTDPYVEVPVSFAKAGEATVNLGGVELIFKIDADGSIQSGTVPTQNLTITRK